MKAQNQYPPQTVGGRMSTRLPICGPHDTFEQISRKLAADEYQSVRNVFVVNRHHTLLGYIDTGLLMRGRSDDKASELMQPADVILHPHADQEKAVFLAVKNDIVSIPVADKDGRFLGAITAHTIIDIMHEEHIEDSLLTAGIRGRGSDIFRLASERAGLVVGMRLPWLVLGLTIGLCLGLIASLFEETLSRSIALTFFIPVVAYIAGAVGAQSGAIAIRGLALLKLNYFRYAAKELVVGVLLGAFLGLMGGLGAYVISRSSEVAAVVGLALLAACMVSTMLASLIPFLFKKLGKDPAVGSGPIATALQDVLSILIYFLIARAII